MDVGSYLGKCDWKVSIRVGRLVLDRNDRKMGSDEHVLSLSVFHWSVKIVYDATFMLYATNTLEH